MDGTLLEEQSSWAKIHRHFGTTEVGLRGFEQYERGLIEYDQFMEQDVAAWPKGTHISEIDRILSDYTLKRDAAQTVTRLKKRMHVVMVSAGLDVLAKRVAEDLQIERWIANSLNTDSEGRLIGGGKGRVDPSKKELVLEEILSSLSLTRDEAIAVGDSVYDLSILRAVRVGFLMADSAPPRGAEGIVLVRNLSEIFGHPVLDGY
jgi:phosphoserine phosphatase